MFPNLKINNIMLRFKDFLIKEESILDILSTKGDYEDMEEWIISLKHKDISSRGQGAFGVVLTSPNWNGKVVKLFSSNDECYIRFIRYVYENPDKHLPKVYNKPKRFIPPWDRYEKYYYYVIMDELAGADSTDIYNSIDIASKWNDVLLTVYNNGPDEDIEFMENQFDKFINSYKFTKKSIEFGKFLAEFSRFWANPISGLDKCNIDLHSGNVMDSKDGRHYVLIDPYASLKQTPIIRRNNDYKSKGKPLYDWGSYKASKSKKSLSSWEKSKIPKKDK